MNADDKRNSEVAALKAETEDQSELLLEASPSTSAKRRRSTAAATAAMEGEGVVASTSASASPSFDLLCCPQDSVLRTLFGKRRHHFFEATLLCLIHLEQKTI